MWVGVAGGGVSLQWHGEMLRMVCLYYHYLFTSLARNFLSPILYSKKKVIIIIIIIIIIIKVENDIENSIYSIMKM